MQLIILMSYYRDNIINIMRVMSYFLCDLERYMINLEKGQRINLEKNTGRKLLNFCVGCNWGVIVEREGFLGFGKKIKDVDLDLSCLMFDKEGTPIDHIYSPAYNLEGSGLPKGKLYSIDGALRHTGDDRVGDVDGDDGLDNEIITVDLTKVSSEITQIFFFLNIYTSPDERARGDVVDFSMIPYASIRMYEGTPSKVKEVFSKYDVAASPQYKGKQALIMGKLYKHNGEWKFNAIGDAYDDPGFVRTMVRIIDDYAKSK